MLLFLYEHKHIERFSNLHYCIFKWNRSETYNQTDKQLVQMAMLNW